MSDLEKLFKPDPRISPEYFESEEVDTCMYGRRTELPDIETIREGRARQKAEERRRMTTMLGFLWGTTAVCIVGLFSVINSYPDPMMMSGFMSTLCDVFIIGSLVGGLLSFASFFPPDEMRDEYPKMWRRGED